MRHQYTVLDGLRGVAAISVMLFHRRDWFGGDAFLGHSFLAVDFFFMLSGFVLAHAYGERLMRVGSFWPFVRDRIVRLHPMLVAGAVIAAAVSVVDSRMGRTTANDWASLTFAASLVPAPAPWAGAASAFPWNIALWSLTWELVANLLYAALAARLSDRLLVAIVLTSAAVMMAVSWEMVGFQVGFQNDALPLLLGFPRVCAGFFIGVAAYRWHSRGSFTPHRLGAICTVVLVGSFAVVPLHAAISAIYDPVIAFVLYPAILLFAARATPVMPRLALLLGAISYPLYVIHEPALRAVGGALAALHLAGQPPAIAEAIARLGMVIGIAFLALKLYDEPVRAWLRRRLHGGRTRSQQSRA